jgi:hypothetical protein
MNSGLLALVAASQGICDSFRTLSSPSPTKAAAPNRVERFAIGVATQV